jgi:hypothetical protein
MNREPLTPEQASLAGPRTLKTPGSPEWCWQTVDYLKNCYRHVEEQYRQVDQVIEDLERVEAWKVIPPGNPYGSLERLLEAEGLKLEEVRRKSAAARANDLKGKTINSGDGPMPKGDNANCDNVTVRGETDGGNSADYLTRRIVRDHPDIAEKMRNGEYKSVRAAALDAKIVHPTTTIRTDNAASIVATLRRQLDPETLAMVTKLLLEED